MTTKIEKLTPEQEARIPEYRDKWLKIGLSTEPLDFDKAKEAAIRAYEAAGLKAPEHFFHFRSPMEAAKEIAEMGGISLSDARSSMVYGCHDAGFLSFYSFFGDVCGVEDCEKLRPLMDLAEHCGWWSPFENAVIFQDRPSVIKMDERNISHCEDGPAIEYRDGFSVYCWHGVRFPGEWLSEGGLTPQKALSEENLELRRVACEILGWSTILRQLNAVTIDANESAEIGELLEVDIPDIGREKFLRVMCGTGREFAIPVPPEMKTAHQANAWTYGIDTHEYEPEVRT